MAAIKKTRIKLTKYFLFILIFLRYRKTNEIPTAERISKIGIAIIVLIA